MVGGRLRARDELAEAVGVEHERLARHRRPDRRIARRAGEQADLAEELAGPHLRDLVLAIGLPHADARGALREDEERIRRIALPDDHLAGLVAGNAHPLDGLLEYLARCLGE